MFATDNRDTTRAVFFRAWRRYRDGKPLEGAETLVVQAALQHPEYHRFLEDPDRHRDADFTPEQGRVNPFLHLGMHIAIEEQISIDSPPGIRMLYADLLRYAGDAPALQHRMMDCLGETLVLAGRHGGLPDESGYLDCLRRLART
jgi:hypothetical protein